MASNLCKNIAEILGNNENNYVVPLYQRNFTWGDEEISQLLQDIYDCFLENKDKSEKGNYYIGSLFVLKRKNGDYEVIDGQQRLTAITLIAKILDPKNPERKKSTLFYDSRPEIEAFYNSFYQSPDGNINDIAFDPKISHLVDAVDFINNTKLNSDNNENITIKTISENFRQFFFKNVILVFVELPQDTDVANYFEIMNNRGQQLQKHEILKAKLLDKLKDEQGEYDKIKQEVYSKIWDACSQMDAHIQKSFSSDDRKILFGEKYDSFPNREKIKQLIEKTKQPNDEPRDNYSINYILEQKNYNQNNNTKNNEAEDIEYEDDDKSIVDFPNFLMHIFRLKYGSDVPLNEKELLNIYDKKENDIETENFINDLFYYRTVFDQYIIKATTDENSEEKFEWTLKKPYKDDRNILKYKNTFEVGKQERIIKALSMLQVSFRTRIYKEWLQSVLSWFKECKECNDVDFIKELDVLILKNYKDYKLEIDNDPLYSEGTSTPHFIFNFIDYLYWVESKNDPNKPQFGFDFRYRNSVEHHLPQSFENYPKATLIDNLGNLCLVSKSSNSRMNNEAPTGKASEDGKYYNKGKLTPKRKIMYDLTNKKGHWGDEEIKDHYDDVVELLKKRKEILGIE